MIKRTCFLALLFVLALSLASVAQTLTYEYEGQPLYSITYPAGWLLDLDFAQEAEEAGTPQEKALRIVEARPNDDLHLWVGTWRVPDSSTLDEGAAYLASLGPSLFADVETDEPRDAEWKGMPARITEGTALREGESVELKMAIFEPKKGVIAAVLYVGAVDAWEMHRGELEAIAKSIRPAP